MVWLSLLMKAILSGIVLFQLFCGSISAQQASLDTLSNRYDIRNSVTPEKVHLHLDKPYYAAGQSIWFKVYVVDMANQPSMLSKIIYVDLVDNERRVYKSLKLPLAAGLASGDFALPDTLSGGKYRIRAYTQWMRNYGEDSFYDHPFVIVNSWKAQESKEVVNRPSGKLALKFFPEGGNLIEGLRSRVAFKAIGSDGLGVDVTGYVIDNSGSKVARLKTEHAGMGSFLLTPLVGNNYKVIIDSTLSDQFTLPHAVKDGYIMNVTGNETHSLLVRVTASPSMVGSEKIFKLIMTAFDGSTLQSTFKMTRQFADINLPVTAVPAGVARLTLFDEKDLPAAERLVFIRPDDHLKLKLETEKPVYNTRERVKMTLEASTENDAVVTGSFSISVTDMDRIIVDEVNESTILSELLLKSELKGFIEKPNYYFTSTVESTVRQRHLDNLMLTQGWRRLVWQGEDQRITYYPEDGISISGRLLRGGNIVTGGKVTVFTPDAGILMDTLTNEKGRFMFDRLAFADSMRFVIQGRRERSKANITIELDQVPRQPVTIDNFQPDLEDKESEIINSKLKQLKEELLELLNQGMINRTNILDEVVVKAVKDPKKLENSSKLGNTPADYVFRDDQLSGNNLAFALKGKVLGLDYYVEPRTGAVTAKLPRNNLMSGARNMEIFVDGLHIGDDFSGLNMTDIAYVEVIKGLGANSAIYGDKGFGGVVVVTTKGYAGMPNTIQTLSEGIIKYVPQGYNLSREFYSPDYSVAGTKEDRGDFRSTIFWHPDVFIDKGRNSHIEFFTADTPGTYRVVVEGLDYRGKLGRSSQTFVVR